MKEFTGLPSEDDIGIPITQNAKKAQRVLTGPQFDPTRTTALANRFARDIKARNKALMASVKKYVGEQDVFGLNEPVPMNLVGNARDYAYRTKREKLKIFEQWFSNQLKLSMGEEALSVPWLSKYIDSAYKTGASRAFKEVSKVDVSKATEFAKGAQAGYMRNFTPAKLARIEDLATRAFEELKGISGQMASKMNRIMSDGMLKGQGAMEVADRMVEEAGLTLAQAQRIARTELVRAHSEGQLDTLEELGVEEVGVLVEWTINRGGNVCPYCSNMKNKRFTIAKARGMIPAHPNCRCAWIPYIK